MSLEKVAREEKGKVLDKVEKTLGPTEKAGRGQGFTRFTTSGESWFHILFSKSPLWHGIRPDLLEQASRYKRAHFLFVMRSASQVLVVPAHRIRDIIQKYAMEPKGSNEYQFHIRGTSGAYHFLESPREDLSPYYNHYKAMLALERPTVTPGLHTGANKFTFSSGHNSKKSAAKATYRPHFSEIDLVHNSIQNDLHEHLCQKYGKQNVGTEQDTGYGAQIDLVIFDRDKKYVFYEVKTSSSVQLCIREAFGQLMEYAFYPRANNAKKVIVVSPNPITLEVRAYLRHIRDRFHVPIFYQRYDLEKKTLESIEH